MDAHDRLWLKNKELLKEGCIDILTFDSLPRKRIERILRFQEERLEQQRKMIEEEHRKQERQSTRNNITRK